MSFHSSNLVPLLASSEGINGPTSHVILGPRMIMIVMLITTKDNASYRFVKAFKSWEQGNLHGLDAGESKISPALLFLFCYIHILFALQS